MNAPPARPEPDPLLPPVTSDVTPPPGEAAPATQATGSFPEPTPAPTPTADLQQPFTVVTPSIAIGGYQGPMSVKAAAAFAAGASGLLARPAHPSRPAFGVGIALVAAVCLLLLGAGGAAFWLRVRASARAAPPSLATGNLAVSGPSTTGAPIAPTVATVPPTADPAPAPPPR